MEHELKIIMKFTTEDMDHDQNLPIRNSSILLSIDSHVVGCIQKLKIEADCDQLMPTVEITFPDLESLDYDMTAYQATNPGAKYKPHFIDDIKEHIKLLEIANIQIKSKNIDNGDNVLALTEVGTDGVIDLIPMERRNK